MLTGLKTYIIVAIAVLAAILGYFSGDLTLLQAGEAIGLAFGLGGARAVARVGETINSPYATTGPADPRVRQWITYAGVALAVLSAILAGLNGEQDPVVTIGTILGALGLNFLGLGVKKAVQT